MYYYCVLLHEMALMSIKNIDFIVIKCGLQERNVWSVEIGFNLKDL